MYRAWYRIQAVKASTLSVSVTLLSLAPLSHPRSCKVCGRGLLFTSYTEQDQPKSHDMSDLAVIMILCLLGSAYLCGFSWKHARPLLLGSLRTLAYAWGFIFVAIMYPWIVMLKYLFPIKPRQRVAEKAFQLPRYTKDDLQIPPSSKKAARETSISPSTFWSIALPYPEELYIPPYPVLESGVGRNINNDVIGIEDGVFSKSHSESITTAEVEEVSTTARHL
jgi:hypothetical protein